ncbi:MAG: hypothetical protein WC747_00770 [Candidatus Babeliales bacterium]|jgi:hypothetical protein
MNKIKFSKDKSKFLPTVSMLIFGLLFIASISIYWRYGTQSTDTIIHQDVMMLQKIFKQIHNDCSIVSFAHSKNNIDFLTVKQFVGPEVGAMSLGFSSQWKGPYLKENPTINQQVYQILQTKTGCFIVPGDGVVLSNGKKIGVDFVLDENSDMDEMMQNPECLKSSAGALVAQIPVISKKLQDFIQHPFAFDDID